MSDSLDFFKNLINSSLLGVYIYQEDGKIVFSNKAFADLMGYESPQELIGKSFLDFLCCSDKEKAREVIKRRISGEKFYLEYNDRVYVARDNSRKPIKAFGQTILYKGKYSGLVFVVDQTEEKSLEKLFYALSQINQIAIHAKEEEELLKGVCETLVRIGYASVCVGRIDEKNKRFVIDYYKTRLPDADEIFETVKIKVDGSKPFGRGTVYKAYTSGEIAIISDVLKSGDMQGWWEYHIRYNIHSACSVPIVKDEKIQYILLMHDDVPDSFSDRNIFLLKEIQRDFTFALEKLHKERLLNVLNEAMKKSHDMVVILNSEGEIEYVNDTVLELLGYNRKEMIGNTLDLFIECIESELLGDSVSRNILGCHTKDGNKLCIDATVVPIYFKGGAEPDYFVVSAKDVTDLVMRESQIRFQSGIYDTLYTLNRLYISLEHPEEMLKRLPEIFVDHMDVEAAFVVTLADDGIRISEGRVKDETCRGFIEEFKRSISKVTSSKKFRKTSLYKSIVNRRIYIINDINHKNGLGSMRDVALRYGVSGGCSIPITMENRRYVLVLVTRRKNMFDRKVYDLLKIVQENLAFILDKLKKERFANIAFSALNIGFDFILIMDEKHRVIWANTQAERFFGYAAGGLIGVSFSNLVVGDESDIERDLSDRRQVVSSVFKYRNSNNETVIAPTVITRMRSKEGFSYYIVAGKDITNERKLQKKIDLLVRMDEVTGLPNRRYFLESIKRFADSLPLQSDTIGCVAVINPLGFYQINRALGFESGNEILKEIGRRIRESLRDYDEVAKLESDRFGVLLKGLRNEEDALIVMEKVLDSLRRPYEIDSQQIDISFAVGLSPIPRDGREAAQLINKAQSALADAKARGENSCGFFRKEVEVQAFNKLRLKKEINRALNKEEFILFYQPYFDSNGTVIGSEALLRWKKGKKVIPPVEFISYLEESGLIVDAEKLALKVALDTIKRIKQEKVQPICVSLNVSPVSLKKEGFFDYFCELVRRSGVEPTLVNVEIVERSFLDDIEYATSLLEKMRSKGFRVLIDDFGTGYSSLSYLSRLPIDYVKIDISFIRRLLDDDRTASVVKTIINLSHDLGMKTIAEGVEQKKQFETLKSLGCDYFQGYLFAHPMPKGEFINLLRKSGKTK